MLRLLGILALGNMILGDRGCRRHDPHHNSSILGGLFILPMMMFGGWIAIAVIGGVLGLISSVIGGIFSGLSSLASAAFSGSGLVIGILIGLVAFYWIRNRNARNSADAGTEE